MGSACFGNFVPRSAFGNLLSLCVRQITAAENRVKFGPCVYSSEKLGEVKLHLRSAQGSQPRSQGLSLPTPQSSGGRGERDPGNEVARESGLHCEW